MSTTDAPFAPVDHVTQREPGPWRDCTFASFLEVVRDGFPDGRSIPPTEAEKEALRAAAGLPDDHTGATIAQGIAACEKRYGLSGGYEVTSEWLKVRAALGQSTKRLVVQGSMGSVTPWLRRHDPNFAGPHAIAARGLVWCDPLAPKGTYTGEQVPIGTWESFWRGLPGAQAFITTVGGLTRGNPMIEVSETTPLSVDIGVGKQLYDLNEQPLRKVSVYQNDIYSPFATGAFRAVVLVTGGARQLVLVKAVDATDRKPLGDVKKTVTVTVSDGRPPVVITGV